MTEQKIPRATAKRLPIYYRYLKLLLDEGKTKISSVDLAEIVKIDAATIRRDFSCFGALGKRGYGYDVAELIEFFAGELNQDNLASVALIGLGNLGHALLNFKFQKTSNVRVSAVFEVKPELINTIQSGVPVFSMDELEEQIEEQRIDVAMLTVPADAAQTIATRLEASGIKGILNFTPMRLNVSRKVHVQNVDLTNELQTLLYFIDNDISN
ncbi:redox-sensing transcriptional repressor Rex [Weissella koreensis]|uniref:Redox-sensing transcriptional repressor Rex n=1 Tax=Weissella koreensis TaxID=165096 RepID=A0A7H1MMS0_9LACO|nr:redox-sensing transcriptional repressor Rex [Weissella koreensis]AEJ23932.1 redox-sensing transcriptional repressor Rex [Weissella koreensis KACC 15510]AVH75554.1 redox-sensing transcriptional repressor Rex [Weissella koreensis]MCZ9311603.1 redox-sensing transcriptional repressor Rex [Weissella koreensis]QGN20775.1 redox-sensing transcriptional repressor Rex [Weissella koreensis]QNT64756.1 redox-sensing transcriptional repressor Rex [Weissella koreensis]